MFSVKIGSKSEPLFYCDLNAAEIKFKKFTKLCDNVFKRLCTNLMLIFKLFSSAKWTICANLKPSSTSKQNAMFSSHTIIR